MKRNIRIFLFLLALISTPRLLWGEDTEKKEFSSKLIVLGPGDTLYSWWGHVGIVIDHNPSEESAFYDFGNFSFGSENFYGNFAMGRLLYAASEAPAGPYLDYTLGLERDVTVLHLDLPQDRLKAMSAYLKNLVLPENSQYLYDHYTDNCSTRIRDLLDEAVGGGLKREYQGIPAGTFRLHSRLRTAHNIPGDYLIDFLIGPLTDKPISAWDEMFVPSVLVRYLQDFTYEDDQGNTRKILRAQEKLVVTDRDPIPAVPPLLWPRALLAGLAGALLSFMAWRARSSLARTAALVWQITIILFTGIWGLFFAFLLIFSDHTTAHGNLNAGPVFPLVLLGLVPAIRGFLGRKGAREALATAWTTNLAGLFVVMILHFTGILTQSSLWIWALWGPIILASSWPGLLLSRQERFRLRFKKEQGF